MKDNRFVRWTATRELMEDKRHLPLLAEMLKGWVILDARATYHWAIEYMGWHPDLPQVPEGQIIPECQVQMKVDRDWERGEELITWFFMDGERVLIKGDMIRPIDPFILAHHHANLPSS